MAVALHLCAASATQQEVVHELLPVFHIQVAVALQGAPKLAAHGHDLLHTSHQELAHGSKIGHVLHVGLCGHGV